MNEGKYVFAQIADFIPRYQFDKLVKKYHGDYRAHELTCYNQFLHLLFGQLTPCTSLRDICMCLAAHQDCLYHLGFRNTVEQSTLSRANERRDYRIYEGLGYYLIKMVRPYYRKTTIPDIEADNALFALDSTTISISIKLAICAYLIVALIKARYQSQYSITEVATLLSVSALERTDLEQLITKPNDRLCKLLQNQNVKDQQLSLIF